MSRKPPFFAQSATKSAHRFTCGGEVVMCGGPFSGVLRRIETAACPMAAIAAEPRNWIRAAIGATPSKD
jgi:hypothetical protein